MKKFELTIVIPCYNESGRLSIDEFRQFFEHRSTGSVCFVNDASTDGTHLKMNALKEKFPRQIAILTNEQNLGKAESVRRGIRFCHKEEKARAFAYLDADLATSLDECFSLSKKLSDEKEFVFASRILKIGATVERKFSRFLLGRIIATLISNILDIKVYDTQCGCKVFQSHLSEILFKDAFISKWLFDVELFSRMLCAFGKKKALSKMDEIPVKSWIDKGESRVKISYIFRLWFDLYAIHKKHKGSYTFTDLE